MDCEGGSNDHLEEESSPSLNKRVTFSPLIVVLNSDQSEIYLKGPENSSAGSPDSSGYVPPSSSNSSFDDFIPINPHILQNSRGENDISQPNGVTKPSHVNEKYNVANDARLVESINDSPESASQSSDITQESETEHMLPTLSPSIQVMERPQSFDSNGNSASHLRRPPTQKEGSFASDDFLFSINIGNKWEDVPELDMGKDIGKDVKQGDKGMADEPIDDVAKAPGNNLGDTNVSNSGDSSSAKCESDKIVSSNQPIALPIKKNSSSLLHHCPDCCPAFRCCKLSIHCSKRPGCSFKWFIQPSCSRNCFSWLGSCCKLPSCNCKCPTWSSCCVKRRL